MKDIDLHTKIGVYTIDECTNLEKKLIEAAKEATKKSYAPYSQFNVGAALYLDNGEIISAGNQENASYPQGLCAERTAMFYANSNYPNNKVLAIAVAAFNKGKFTEMPITPCGGCRQVLLETENRFNAPLKIYMVGEDSVYVVNTIKDLLPLSFGDSFF